MSAEQGYLGLCNLCGNKGMFLGEEGRSVRESYACPHCRASLRYRDQAALMLDEFARGRSISLRALITTGCMDGVSIYEAALQGPFVNAFRRLPGYVQSYYWPDRPTGSVDERGVRCEDLAALSLPANSFDLVITSDVMEHVYGFREALAEITRVLKPGGVHIFSIPTDWPLPERTVTRVERVNGEEVHVLPARYHRGGDGTPSLVYHDYGSDLIDMIDADGCRTQVVRRHSPIDPCYVNATFITRKLA